MEAESLWQYCTNLTEKTTLFSSLLIPGKWGRGMEVKVLGSTSRRPVSILKAIIRTMQPLFIGEMAQANYQPCSLSPGALQVVGICNGLRWSDLRAI